jgi:hypothetical protein
MLTTTTARPTPRINPDTRMSDINTASDGLPEITDFLSGDRGS